MSAESVVGVVIVVPAYSCISVLTLHEFESYLEYSALSIARRRQHHDNTTIKDCGVFDYGLLFMKAGDVRHRCATILPSVTPSRCAAADKLSFSPQIHAGPVNLSDHAAMD